VHLLRTRAGVAATEVDPGAGTSSRPAALAAEAPGISNGSFNGSATGRQQAEAVAQSCLGGLANLCLDGGTHDSSSLPTRREEEDMDILHFRWMTSASRRAHRPHCHTFSLIRSFLRTSLCCRYLPSDFLGSRNRRRRGARGRLAGGRVRGGHGGGRAPRRPRADSGGGTHLSPQRLR
jgi:hypothetical protein